MPSLDFKITKQSTLIIVKIGSVTTSKRTLLRDSVPRSNLFSVIAVNVRYFVDSLLDPKWAFKKLPKSIPEALKKVTIISVISKEQSD